MWSSFAASAPQRANDDLLVVVRVVEVTADLRQVETSQAYEPGLEVKRVPAPGKSATNLTASSSSVAKSSR